MPVGVEKLELETAHARRRNSLAFLDRYPVGVAPRVKDAFWGKAVMALDGALRLLDANVSAKLIFADLANRFYLYI